MFKSVLFKLLVCLLILALLPANALADGWFNALFGGVDSPQLRFVSVPERAFSTENARVIAATGDGQKVLIMNGYELYLWDVNANKRIPLRLTKEEDIEKFNFMLETAFVLSLSRGKEQKDSLQKRFEETRDRYFQQHELTRFTSFDEISECFPKMLPIGGWAREIGSRYALIEANQLGALLLTDLLTGESRFIESKFVSLCDDKLFNLDDGGIMRLETGEKYYPSYSKADGEGLSTWFKTVKLLKDDSVLTLIPASETKENYTRDMHLVDVSTERALNIAIGTYEMTREPSTLLVTGNGKYAAAYYPYAYATGQTVLLDRESGEAKSLGTDSLMLVSSTEEAFLCYDLESYQLILLDPETFEQSPIKATGLGFGSTITYTMISRVTDNGAGLYFIQGEIMHGYFKLEK